MPIQYEVHTLDRIVQVTLADALAVADYTDAARRIVADASVRPGFGLLIDGRTVHPLPGMEELRELVEVARHLRVHGIEPYAIVAATELQFVVGQLFATLAGAMINLDVRVFRTIDIARDWLRVAVAKRGPLPEPHSTPTELRDSGETSASTASVQLPS